MSSTIRVAISGGGLAGATLFHSLLHCPHLDVHIFESATAFKEAGMAIGVTRNALATLELIGPSAVQALEWAGAVPMRGVRFMVAQGEGQGNLIDEVDEATTGQRLTSIVHRATFLRELLAHAPQNRMHASKKLHKVYQEPGGPVILHFTDETTHECDILIGADGIHSTVRQLILGNDPAATTRNTGVWLIMTLQPYTEARASVGKGSIDFECAREYSWIGHGTYVLHNLLSDGQLVQFVVASVDMEADSGQWHRTVTADKIKRLYQDWPPHLTKAINELFCNQPEHKAIYLWEHPPAPTYVSGPVCVMGDAAHATTPWQGSGGGMSIEDSMILYTLLGRSKTAADALTALKVYDQVRRPRTQRIVESSRVTGEVSTGISEQTASYVKRPGTLLRRWNFILDIDMENHRNEAISIMETALEGGRARFFQ
ncbi:putative Salicylate hydroxylase [Seiridium cardinale]|uniref:Salicylate hydroxylase n=1 Tax=Seiridium cardinale TaxID=138064 RepID=A0ABR2XDZ6_9PEZI